VLPPFFIILSAARPRFFGRVPVFSEKFLKYTALRDRIENLFAAARSRRKEEILSKRMFQ
jgi:hypothetical protein